MCTTHDGRKTDPSGRPKARSSQQQDTCSIEVPERTEHKASDSESPFPAIPPRNRKMGTRRNKLRSSPRGHVARAAIPRTGNLEMRPTNPRKEDSYASFRERRSLSRRVPEKRPQDRRGTPTNSNKEFYHLRKHNKSRRIRSQERRERERERGGKKRGTFAG